MKIPAIHHRSAHPTRKGFTMLELVITILIIVILATLSMPAYNSVRKRAYWSKTTPQMRSVIEAFNLYAVEHGDFYPPAYFPEGASDSDSSLLDSDLEGDSGWLNSTIYSQLYPRGDSGSGDDSDSSDGDEDFSLDQDDVGEHLRGTVFVVQASELANR
ncbi:MAG: prepilin-type N-terminal cleavage/methylation domain-containing protein, partial [Verrucomicrobiota bacterium]